MSANDSPTGHRYAIRAFTSIGHKLYLDDDSADFHFIFKSKSDDGQSERIPVHKILLRNVSDVFQVMFNESWKEKVNVEIVDASVDAFREFLQFFYLSEVKVTMENVAVVMYLGEKYNVTKCFEICSQFLKDYVIDDDVCFVYELASHMMDSGLEHQCVEYIEKNAKTVLRSKNFLACDRKTVEMISQMDFLLQCSEVEVFEALMKWMKAKIVPVELTQDIIQSQFSSLLHEIRFRSMTPAEFASLSSMYNHLFTSAENDEIIQMINTEQFQPKIFKGKFRNREIGYM